MKTNKVEGNKMIHKKYTLLETIAIKIFKKNFDFTLSFFNTIKLLSKKVRYLFYIFLITTVSASLYFFSYLVDLNSYDVPSDVIDTLNIIGFCILAIGIFLVSTIVGYESLIVRGVQDKDIKEYVLEIKRERDKKKQLWRLRNMNLFFRLFFYLWIWISLKIVSYFVIASAIFKSNYSIQVNEKQAYLYLESLDNSLLVSTLIVSLIVLILVLRVETKKKEKYNGK